MDVPQRKPDQTTQKTGYVKIDTFRWGAPKAPPQMPHNGGAYGMVVGKQKERGKLDAKTATDQA